MKNKRYTEEQIIGFLKAHEAGARIGDLVRYVPQRPVLDAALVARMKQLGEQYPRYGYLMLHELLRREGLVVNRKRTYRIYSNL